MPTFYFDIRNGTGLVCDDTGLQLQDLEAARDEAVGILKDLARELPTDADLRTFATSVRDEAGRVLFRAHLRFVAERLSEGDD